ncbi:MAG: hypothetical protein IPK00_10355 [Deltaproteobacteria bacterium]|nr:hypothetical protein [Deltaproteobacteria bacterium]
MDGRFFTGVTTTGVFCPPYLPAPAPKPANCRYFRSAAAARTAASGPACAVPRGRAPERRPWRGARRRCRGRCG